MKESILQAIVLGNATTTQEKEYCDSLGVYTIPYQEPNDRAGFIKNKCYDILDTTSTADLNKAFNFKLSLITSNINDARAAIKKNYNSEMTEWRRNNPTKPFMSYEEYENGRAGVMLRKYQKMETQYKTAHTTLLAFPKLKLLSPKPQETKNSTERLAELSKSKSKPESKPPLIPEVTKKHRNPLPLPPELMDKSNVNRCKQELEEYIKKIEGEKFNFSKSEKTAAAESYKTFLEDPSKENCLAMLKHEKALTTGNLANIVNIAGGIDRNPKFDNEDNKDYSALSKEKNDFKTVKFIQEIDNYISKINGEKFNLSKPEKTAAANALKTFINSERKPSDFEKLKEHKEALKSGRLGKLADEAARRYIPTKGFVTTPKVEQTAMQSMPKK